MNMAAFRGELNRALTRARQLGYQLPVARHSAPVIGVWPCLIRRLRAKGKAEI